MKKPQDLVCRSILNKTYKYRLDWSARSKNHISSWRILWATWFFRQAICTYSFVTPKSYTKDVRARVPLESRVCIQHNKKALVGFVSICAMKYMKKFLWILGFIFGYKSIQYGTISKKLDFLKISFFSIALTCLENFMKLAILTRISSKLVCHLALINLYF